jgi:peptide/nickel transport system substrate-binding protein
MRKLRLDRRQLLVSGSVAAGALTLAACGAESGTIAGSSDDGARPTRGGELTWAVSADPVFMVPFGATLGATREATEQVYESLLTWDRDLRIVPALASRWSTPDETTFEFTLRDDARFHDGRAVTARDVVYSVGLQRSPPPPGTTDMAVHVPAIADVRAVGERTVRIEMERPDARLPGFLAWGRHSSIVPEGMYDAIDPRTEAIGTGPFRLVDFRQNDRVVFERNDGFRDPAVPGVDRLTLRVMTDEQGRLAALRAGQIDGCTVSPDIAEVLGADPSIEVLRGLVAAHRELQFTVQPGEAKPWHDKRVRQALNHAIDRQDLIDRVYAGNAEWSGIVPPGYGEWALDDAELRERLLVHDPERARALLAGAGFADGFPIELEVAATTPDLVKSAEILQQQLGAVGIELKIRPIELAAFAANNGAGRFDLHLTYRGMRGDVAGFMTDFDPEQPLYREVWFPAVRDVDPRLGRLIAEGATTIEESRRRPIYAEAQRLALTEALHVPLCNPYKFQAVSRRVSGMYVAYTDFNPGLATALVRAS